MHTHKSVQSLFSGIRENGTTLVELMVAVFLLTVVSVSLVGVFANLSKEIQGSKSRTLATNLAQEKMQILKGQTFNKVLVTTTTSFLTGFTPNIPYDTGYYPPEAILEGGMRFTRYTYIEVAGENSGSLVYYGAVPDTGMKAATISVVWTEGATPKKVQFRSIIGNINTTMSNAIVKGKVSISTSAATGIQSALVTVAENVGFQDFTDSGGNYLINLLPGTYTMNASAKGYFPSFIQVSVAPNATLVQPFSLVAMASGTVQGTAWINDHVVISQVMASTQNAAGFCQEFVEVFNPTTATVAINGNIELRYQHFGDPISTPISMNYNTNSVPPSSYYLFANTSPVVLNGITRVPDAVYSNLNTGYPDLIWVAGPSLCGSESNKGDADSIALASISSGLWIDMWGWTTSSHQPPLSETAAYVQGVGLQDDEQFIRRSSTAGIVAGVGRAYETNNNSVDILGHSPAVSPVNNSAVSEPVVAGVPAVGAFVTATDGLSQVTVANSVGSPPVAQFQLTSVATGTWTVYVASSSAFIDITSVTVAANATTYVPNSVTTPIWPVSGQNAIVLSSIATQGYITGTVQNSFGSAIAPSITVSANSFSAPANTSNGAYFLPVPAGTYEVFANAINPSSLYVSQSSDTVVVNLGEVTSGVNFSLSQGGKIRGFVTRDGINPLPGIVFTATDGGGTTKDQEVSANDGRFLLMNLSTGTYTVSPALDIGEVSVPASSTVTVTAGVTTIVTTFTVTGAFGTIKGSVTDTGQSIKTGVLIVCSTMTFAGSVPPTLNFNSLTGASTYVTNSYEDGTYSMDVRESTSTTYRIYAYYPKFNGTTPVVNSTSTAGISVTAGQTTSGVNFAF